MGDAYTPKKSDRFTFGMWTVGNVGKDPFGDPVRRPIPATRMVKKLSELGAWGVNFHDNDLVPIDASLHKRNQIVRDFKKALKDYDMVVPMATTNTFSHPVFKDGGFTSNDPKVRAYGLQKIMRAIDLGAEVGAKIYVFWGGREGAEVNVSKDPVEAVKRFRDGLNYLCRYARDKKYGMKFALEAKPNEPRADIYFPTTGHYLGLIETLDYPNMVGVNPEVAHEHMAGLNFHHGVAQALDAGKLFHIDLNDQRVGRYDQDFRFGSEDYKSAFHLVKLLEERKYRGPKHFDAHAYRTEDENGVWDFALGCMRTYNILREKVKRFQGDEEIQEIIETIESLNPEFEKHLGKYSRKKAQALKRVKFDIDAMGKVGLGYERLDQLLAELLLGMR
ncbi:xylose isomerase [bacterium]|nr:xylose isomerase [Gemmatimonadota bacterium]MCH2664218.1 xylose isomerase [bacterium]HCK11223.1 xylose isomerase [Candidatus Latescibacterota bacterium]